MIAADAKKVMSALPFAPASTILEPGPVLILAPHADDESLGCGGLIALAAAGGHAVHVVILTDGAGSHPNSKEFPPARLRAVREQEALTAITILGLGPADLSFLRLPDTAAPVAGPAFEHAIHAIGRLILVTGAATILAPWQHDPHCDHEAAHLMAVAVAERHRLRQWAYPVWGWTLPDTVTLRSGPMDGIRIDIAEALDRKRRAIASHRTQYAGLIMDDPAGFQLPQSLLTWFDRPFEVYLPIR